MARIYSYIIADFTRSPFFILSTDHCNFAPSFVDFWTGPRPIFSTAFTINIWNFSRFITILIVSCPIFKRKVDDCYYEPTFIRISLNLVMKRFDNLFEYSLSPVFYVNLLSFTSKNSHKPTNTPYIERIWEIMPTWRKLSKNGNIHR